MSISTDTIKKGLGILANYSPTVAAFTSMYGGLEKVATVIGGFQKDLYEKADEATKAKWDAAAKYWEARREADERARKRARQRKAADLEKYLLEQGWSKNMAKAARFYCLVYNSTAVAIDSVEGDISQFVDMGYAEVTERMGYWKEVGRYDFKAKYLIAQEILPILKEIEKIKKIEEPIISQATITKLEVYFLFQLIGAKI